MRSTSNIFWLGLKELHSFAHDWVLIGLVIFAFSIAVTAQAQSRAQELYNAAIGFVDEDNSELSRRIIHAFLPPYYKSPQPVDLNDVDPLMNTGKFTFIVDIPPNFQRDLLAGRQPAIQVNVDATAMVQAGLGSRYTQQIITTEINDFVSHIEGWPMSPINLTTRIAFNPNVATSWFTSVMALINWVTMLGIIMAGAAVVREREHGTMDHLLVMPVSPFEIAASKVWANGLVITAAAGLSLTVVVRTWRPDRWVGTAVYGGNCIIFVLRHCYRHLPRDRGPLDAAARVAVHVRRAANGRLVRQQHPARKHATVACNHHAGIALDTLRVVRTGDSLSRCRL
jgi:ABC-2 type transport system permease protein